jgi:PAS domain-containing protein
MLLVEPKSGAIVEANNSAAKYYGYPRETLCKMTIQDIKCLPLKEALEERQQAKREERKTLFDFLSYLSDSDISVLFQVLDVAHQNLIYESTDELLVMDQFMTSLWLAARAKSI